MQLNYRDCYEKAVAGITKELKNLLMSVESHIKNNCSEIRLRINKPVSLVCGDQIYYLNIFGEAACNDSSAYLCTKEILNDTFSRICSYSIHTYQADIINGFVTLEGGHRAGVSGTAAVDSKGNILSVRDISSINIRVAREIRNCADRIISEIYAEGNKSIIIAGPPASGKTTVIRDLVRQLSDRGNKLCLIDERQEIACVSKGIPQNDVGVNTDIFNGYPKEKAINIAVRTMSPDIITVDEVCETGELRAIENASNCGVKLIVSVHASSFDDVLKRMQILSLIRTGAFDKLVLLEKGNNERKISVFDIEEINDEIFRRRADMGKLSLSGLEGLDAI